MIGFIYALVVLVLIMYFYTNTIVELEGKDGHDREYIWDSFKAQLLISFLWPITVPIMILTAIVFRAHKWFVRMVNNID